MTLSPVFMETHSCPRNRKSSSLLSSFRKTFYQFPASLTLACVFPSLCFPCFVVIAVAHFHGLPNIEQLSIAFGTGNGFRYIPIHEIDSALCPQMAKGVLFFHAFTGCDVAPYFTNRGKKSPWKTWLAWPEITGSFVTLSLPCTAGPVVI